MEASTLNTQYQNQSVTTTPMDNNLDAWRVVVPLLLVVTCITLCVTVTATIISIVVYKKHKRSAVFPVVERRTVDGAVRQSGKTSSAMLSEAESQRAESSNQGRAIFTFSDSNDDFEVTRTKSLTVLVPRGKNLRDVFKNAQTDPGEFQEPDEMHGKLRWQVIQLEPLISDQRSDLSLSVDEDEEVAETVYRQGVYMDWNSTLSDLRTAFIETNQLDNEDLTFCFLHSDVLGEFINIDKEATLCLNKLGRAITRARTIYIEIVDPITVQRSLCVCGRCALFQCSHCRNRGYCSQDCELDDASHHILNCSVDIAHDLNQKRRVIEVVHEDAVL